MTEGVAGQTLGSYSIAIEQSPATVALSPRLRWKITQVLIDLATVFTAALGTYTLYLVSGVGRSHYDPVAAWMDEKRPDLELLWALLAEAEEVLGIEKTDR